MEQNLFHHETLKNPFFAFWAGKNYSSGMSMHMLIYLYRRGQLSNLVADCPQLENNFSILEMYTSVLPPSLSLLNTPIFFLWISSSWYCMKYNITKANVITDDTCEWSNINLSKGYFSSKWNGKQCREILLRDQAQIKIFSWGGGANLWIVVLKFIIFTNSNNVWTAHPTPSHSTPPHPNPLFAH